MDALILSDDKQRRQQNEFDVLQRVLLTGEEQVAMFGCNKSVKEESQWQ
jgi:hypothetical protein